jgi:subtilisin family serine protease
MMKRLLLLSFLLAPCLFGAETHRYIVGTTRTAAAFAKPHILSDAAQAGERHVRTFESLDGFAADLTDDEAAAMRKSPGVRYVSRTIAIHATDAVTPSRIAPRPKGNPLAVKQTVPPNIDMIHARDVWPLTRGGNVNVAIFDTGVDFKHADLMANIAGGYNTFDQSNNFNDDNHHGTHVSGIIGAADNNIGVVGVAPGTHIYAVKVLDAFGDGTNENLVAAIDWVIAQKHAKGGNWIVSMSLGADSATDPEIEAFQRLTDEGVLSIAAAGNGAMQLSYPAALPDIVSVGAVDENNVLADFSNTGPTLNVVAPGVSILSTLPTGSIVRAITTLVNGDAISSATVNGGAFADATGQWVFCNYGGSGDFPAEAQGKIAVMMRGNSLLFSQKVRNARAAGAIGAVIVNNDPTSTNTNWTLIGTVCVPGDCHDDPVDLAYDWPVVVSMSSADGAKLLAGAKQTITISAYHDDYGTLSGTSMACPHVTGVAALAWSLAPTATAKQVAFAMRATAHDLGLLGIDNSYGFGLVDAAATARWLAPAAFGLPPRPEQRQHGVRH